MKQSSGRDDQEPAYAGDDPKPSCTAGRREEGYGTQLPEEGEPPCSLAAARGWKRKENQTSSAKLHEPTFKTQLKMSLQSSA